MDNNLTQSMKKVSYRNLPSQLSLLLLALTLTFSATSFATTTATVFTQTIDTAAGEKLFKANCGSLKGSRVIEILGAYLE